MKYLTFSVWWKRYTRARGGGGAASGFRIIRDPPTMTQLCYENGNKNIVFNEKTNKVEGFENSFVIVTVLFLVFH